MQYAPIALFTYSRADHTQRAVESLLQNAEASASDLFIFSDGPKTEEKRAAVEENRRYIHSIVGFNSITIIEREKNWGLANSLIAGITEVISQYGKVIVVEDDLILSPYFLKFMNEGLEKYENEDKVGAISAFVPPVDEKLPETFFLTYFECWGWATWKREWDSLNTDVRYLLRRMRFHKKKFDVGGHAGCYGNLYCQKVGLVDSWYVQFYATLFINDKLILYPGQSLVENIGLDGTGTHCSTEQKEKFAVRVSVLPNSITKQKVEEDKYVYQVFSSYFDSLESDGGWKHYYYDLKSFLRRLFYIDCL